MKNKLAFLRKKSKMSYAIEHLIKTTRGTGNYFNKTQNHWLLGTLLEKVKKSLHSLKKKRQKSRKICYFIT